MSCDAPGPAPVPGAASHACCARPDRSSTSLVRGLCPELKVPDTMHPLIPHRRLGWGEGQAANRGRPLQFGLQFFGGPSCALAQYPVNSSEAALGFAPDPRAVRLSPRSNAVFLARAPGAGLSRRSLPSPLGRRKQLQRPPHWARGTPRRSFSGQVRRAGRRRRAQAQGPAARSGRRSRKRRPPLRHGGGDAGPRLCTLSSREALCASCSSRRGRAAAAQQSRSGHPPPRGERAPCAQSRSSSPE